MISSPIFGTLAGWRCQDDEDTLEALQVFDEKPEQEIYTGSLTVEVDGVHFEQGGKLFFALYNSKDTWLKAKEVFQAKTAEVSEKIARISFDNIPYSDTYALFVYHDKNQNEKLDFRKFPFPKPREGLSVSNNAVRMGRPYFDKACFSVKNRQTLMRINMHYE